jgi:hypothetical protein
MSPPEFVTINPQEDRLGPSTPPPHVTSVVVPVPMTPVKQSTTNAVIALDDATTDFAINCIGGKIMAHKAVLVARSPYFTRMFRFDGKVWILILLITLYTTNKNPKETHNNEVHLDHVSCCIMRYALDYMYTCKYTISDGEIVPTGYCNHFNALYEPDAPMRARIFRQRCQAAGRSLAPHHLLPHIHVYALADYLDMDKLKQYARWMVKHVLHVYWKDDRIKWKAALDAAFSGTYEMDRGVRIPFIGIMQDHPSLWVDPGDISTWLAVNRTDWVKLAVE